jgi:Fic family protein
MFLEKRKDGKVYLVHSYRLGNKVRKLKKYLGSNLTASEIDAKRDSVEQSLHKLVHESFLSYELTKDEIDYYKKFDVKIDHLEVDWKQFTEQFTYNTNAIEGSTILFSEVQTLLSKTVKPKDEEEKETIAVAKAVDYIRKKHTFTLNFIKKLHTICFIGTKPFAGTFRDVEVVIKDRFANVIHQGAPADEVEKLLQKLVNWYNDHKDIYPPLYLAAMVHNEFEHIHPFQDGNGRVGRLLLNYVLLSFNYPPINIKLENRQDYYEILRKYDNNDIISTMKFLIEIYREQFCK